MKGTLPVLTPDVLVTKLLIYGLHLFGQLSHTACENIKLATIFASKRLHICSSHKALVISTRQKLVINFSCNDISGEDDSDCTRTLNQAASLQWVVS